MEDTNKEVEKTVVEPTVEKIKVTTQQPKRKVVSKVKPNVIKPKVDNSQGEKKSILKNTLGKEVPESDYFYKGNVPSGFKGTCGEAVVRDDLLTVFHKIFKPEDNILFYKQTDKEVYLVIIPIKYSTSIGDFNDSIEGDFQKHAISFLNEGSVNLDTMRIKLERIKNFVKYSDR